MASVTANHKWHAVVTLKKVRNLTHHTVPFQTGGNRPDQTSSSVAEAFQKDKRKWGMEWVFWKFRRGREMVDHHPWCRCEHLRCQRVSSSAENLSPRWCCCHVNGIAALSGGTVGGRGSGGGEEGGRRAAAAEDASFFSISIPRTRPAIVWKLACCCCITLPIS